MPLRRYLANHEVVTAFEQGWSLLTNGELIAAAEAQNFELLVTTDKNLRYQQNLTDRKIAILVLPFTSWPRLSQHTDSIAEAVNSIQPADFVEWGVP